MGAGAVKTRSRCWPAVLVALAMAPALGWSQGFSTCGNLGNAYGPFDYRQPFPEQKHLVESAHFTPVVEALIRGTTNRNPGTDIDYTLRAFPNHHRALIATIRLGEKENSPQPGRMRYTVECWLERAVRFQPEDVIVRMIRSGYFVKKGRVADALADLKVVEALAGDNPFTHYNLGLSYLEAGEWDKALAQAHRAEALGMQRAELKEKLQEAGRWRDPDPAALAAQAAAASAAAASAP